MGAYFIDSSALAKCYLQELGSDWMQQLIDPAAQHDVSVLRLSEVEVASGLARRRRNGLLSVADEQLLKVQLRAHFATRFRLIDVTSGVVRVAAVLLDAHDLRAYDAIQLATCHLLNWTRDAV